MWKGGCLIGTCHVILLDVILLAKLHDMYLYKTDNFFHINNCLKPVSKVALLHRFYCIWFCCVTYMNHKPVWAHILYKLNGPLQAKMCLRAYAKFTGLDSSCACAKYPGLCYLFIHSVVSNDSVSGQWRPWSDCADAQSDLGPHCPHMPEVMVSHGATQMKTHSL